MQHSKPHSPSRLLGATAPGLGTITAVDPYGFYVLVTDADGLEHHCFISQLEHIRLLAPQSYKMVTRRIG